MAGHDANLDFLRRDETRAVRTEQQRLLTASKIFGLHAVTHFEHVTHRNALSDANRQIQIGVHRFPPAPAKVPVTVYQRDSTALGFADASYDQAVIFFLLHEQPAHARRETLREAIRVTKPGGKVVLVDYHGPHLLHPLRYVFQPVLRVLEPFAIDLWRHHISEWLPAAIAPAQIRKETYFGGLYQKVVITV